MDIDKIRKDFPILNRKVNGKQLIYFDNEGDLIESKRDILKIISKICEVK